MSKRNTTLITRDLEALAKPTANIYETTAAISQRAKQIARQTKKELNEKLAAFVVHDLETPEEIVGESDHTKISKYYEQQPKPTLIATEEFLANQVGMRNAGATTTSNVTWTDYCQGVYKS